MPKMVFEISLDSPKYQMLLYCMRLLEALRAVDPNATVKSQEDIENEALLAEARIAKAREEAAAAAIEATTTAAHDAQVANSEPLADAANEAPAAEEPKADDVKEEEKAETTDATPAAKPA